MIIDLERYIGIRWLFDDRGYIHLRWSCFSHFLDHSSLNRGIGKRNYSNLERDQLVVTITISSIPPVSHVDVEVDVHDAVALPITALVVELSYVIVAHLPKDHEAWGVGHAFSIS